jgi:hypothetical protein
MSKKVRMLTQISGTRDGEAWPNPGGFITVGDDEAEVLIRNGQATESTKGATGEESALLDSHPEHAITGATLDGEEAKKARVAEVPAPHADEPAAYHVPVLPGERSAAEAGQVEVDKAQAEQGAQRAEVQTELTPSDADLAEASDDARKPVRGTRAAKKAEDK